MESAIVKPPSDYAERVYAGVLGKMIGVYLGRPFEGWSHERILAELGEIRTYVHERLGMPLIVTDDDLTGTFTFPQTIPDHDYPAALTPQHAAESWLNYVIEGRTIFWWGGVGCSTEHTAYARLRSGVPAPESGSIARNGAIVAQQIGAQIFIDGWAMIAPGDPERAASLARCAASVSHDGEAIYAAQVIAAIESLAFVETDLNRLLDEAALLIPDQSIIHELIYALREQHARSDDWRRTFAHLRAHYWSDRFPGVCHVVPNHGIILMSLLHGNDDFQRALTIACTAGFDTDCNAGNVGCILGIKNGLAGLDSEQDWRAPLADRLFKPTADGGAAITDAAQEALNLVNIGRRLAGQEPMVPKAGARFHFEFPGAVQGFQAEASEVGRLELANTIGRSTGGMRSLGFFARDMHPEQPLCASTAVFLTPDVLTMPGYPLLASPALYPGQVVHAAWRTDERNRHSLTTRLYIDRWTANDNLERIHERPYTLDGGQAIEVRWRIPMLDGHPIARIGLELRADTAGDAALYLDFLTWTGEPDVLLAAPQTSGGMWKRAWVDAVDRFELPQPHTLRISQNEGRGLLIQGTRAWRNYRIETTLRPYLARSFGLAARVQGLRRWYGLLLTDEQQLILLKCDHGLETILAQADFDWQVGQNYRFTLEVSGDHLKGWVGDQNQLSARDPKAWEGGAAALLIEEGCLDSPGLAVRSRA